MSNSNDIASDGITSVDQWEALVEHSSDIITVLDDDGVVQFDSPAVERILGYQSGELVGESAFEYIHSDDQDKIVGTFDELVDSSGEITERVEYRFRHADGTWVWLETVGRNRKDTDLDGYVLTSRDITERKRRERDLRETKQLLSNVLDNLNSVVWLRNPQSEFLLVNDEYRRVFDIDDDTTVVGKTPTDVLGEDVGEQFKEHDRRTLQEGETVEFEEEVLFDDETRQYLTRVTPLCEPDGTVYATCGIATDITAQKEREAKLRERVKELNALHSTTELFARDTPSESLLEELVAELPEWFQYPERTEVQISFDGMEIASDGFDPDQRGVSAVTTAERGSTLRVEVVYLEDSQRSEQVQFLPEEQRLVKTITTYLGETLERRKQEQDLKLFKRAVGQAGYAVVITDRDGTIEYVNPAFEAQSGFTREEALGQTPRILKSGKHDQTFYEQLWETILTGEVWEAEVVNRRKDGALYYTDQVISPITDGDGEITHLVAIESESTSRRIREQQLGVLNRILRHNLRNSLTVIGSHATLLRNTLDDPEQECSIATIQDHVEKLTATSNKVATVRSLFQTEPRTDAVCDIASLLRRIEAAVREEHPDVNLTVTCPETVTVSTDQRVVLAIEEAVENAIVHNDSQPPAVSVVVTAPDGDESVEIEIVDNGPGILEEQYVMLETTAETPLEHGSGIGLWMIHWIVTTFGGEVSIEPRESQGTRVRLRLPTPGD